MPKRAQGQGKQSVKRRFPDPTSGRGTVLIVWGQVAWDYVRLVDLGDRCSKVNRDLRRGIFATSIGSQITQLGVFFVGLTILLSPAIITIAGSRLICTFIRPFPADRLRFKQIIQFGTRFKLSAVSCLNRFFQVTGKTICAASIANISKTLNLCASNIKDQRAIVAAINIPVFNCYCSYSVHSNCHFRCTSDRKIGDLSLSTGGKYIQLACCFNRGPRNVRTNTV